MNIHSGCQAKVLPGSIFFGNSKIVGDLVYPQYKVQDTLEYWVCKFDKFAIPVEEKCLELTRSKDNIDTLKELAKYANPC